MSAENVERDILRAKDVMTHAVLTVQPDWPLEQLADFLIRNGIHGAPVTSIGGELLGVVSTTDLARATTLSDRDLSDEVAHEFYSRYLDEPFPGEGPAPTVDPEHAETRVEEIMTPVVLDVDENEPVTGVAHRMVEGRVHRLMVTREGKIVGVVTALDLLKVMRRQEVLSP
ncbi:MAG: CBS domain-containing protein [Gemmatimonadetes bacterium]|nr:CBS domain-containing protein [Gemmatimonadota bacterium]